MTVPIAPSMMMMRCNVRETKIQFVSFSKLKAATQRISESVSFTQVLRTGRSLTNLGECFAQVILGIISNGAPSIELSGMLKQIRARARRHVEGTGLRDLGSCLIDC